MANEGWGSYECLHGVACAVHREYVRSESLIPHANLMMHNKPSSACCNALGDDQNHRKQKERKRQKHEKVPAKHCFKTRLDMACYLSEVACAGLLENVVAEHHQHTQTLPTRLHTHTTSPIRPSTAALARRG